MAIIKNKLKDNFTMIPNEIINNENISNNAFRLLVYLWSKPTKWEVNQKNIAADFNVHISSIKKWVKELKEYGYIKVIKSNKGQSFKYIYELTHDGHYSIPREDNDGLFTIDTFTMDTSDSVRESVLHINTNNNNTEFSNTYKRSNTKKRFEKPSLEELENYCLEKNLKNVDTEVFMNFYESNGWMVGKNKMKNWKATISNWNKRDFNNSSKQKVIGNMNGWYQEEEKELSDQELKELEEIIKLM